jgi:hypothetical protein
MIAGVGFHPGLVFGGALAQDFLADRRNTALRKKCTTCAGRDGPLR